MTAQNNEQVILVKGNIQITTSRAILGNKTFAMSNITSVSMTKHNPNNTIPIVLILIGLPPVFCGLVNDEWFPKVVWILLGLAMIGGGIYLGRSLKPDYAVTLGSASGETHAYRSKNENQIRAIVNAINEAIVRRG